VLSCRSCSLFTAILLVLPTNPALTRSQAASDLGITVRRLSPPRRGGGRRPLEQLLRGYRDPEGGRRRRFRLLQVHRSSGAFGHWHSAADTTISVPEEGLVRLGAILYGDHLPLLRNPYAKEPFTAAIMDHWISVLDEVVAQSDDKTQFISCHGWGVMTKAQVACLDRLWSEVPVKSPSRHPERAAGTGWTRA
jgi:hypothetical protein